MKKLSIFFIMFLMFFLILFSTKSYAETNPIIKKIESKYSKIKSISALFSQKEVITGYSEALLSRGSFFYLYPDKMVWVYKYPYIQKELFLNNRLYVINSKIKQVLVYNVSRRTGGFPPSIVSLLGNITKYFKIEAVKINSGAGTIEVKMKPLKLQKTKGIYIKFNATTLAINSIIIYTYQGETSTFYSNVRYNREINETIFNNKFPSDYKIINEKE